VNGLIYTCKTYIGPDLLLQHDPASEESNDSDDGLGIPLGVEDRHGGEKHERIEEVQEDKGEEAE
jgi:hypothetical protein